MTSNNIGEQHIRYATLDDFDAVMGINQTIFGGADYLPVMYREFIADPMTRNYVLEISNAVAAFCTISVTNGGRTVILKAARMKKQYQGLGLYWKSFVPKCQSDIRYYFPEVQNSLVMSCLNFIDVKELTNVVSKKNLLHLTCRVTLQACANDISQFGRNSLVANNTVKALQKSDLQMTMENNKKLLEPFLEIAYQPYEVTSANIKYIVDNISPITLANSKQEMSAKSEGAVAGMSFHTHLMSKLGLVIYSCFRVVDKDDFAVHFKALLQYIIDKLITTDDEVFHLYVMFPTHLRFGEVLEIGYGCGLKLGIKDEGILYVSSSQTSYEPVKLDA